MKSYLAGVRGLKHLLVYLHRTHSLVVSRRGTWVETT